MVLKNREILQKIPLGSIDETNNQTMNNMMGTIGPRNVHPNNTINSPMV